MNSGDWASKYGPCGEPDRMSSCGFAGLSVANPLQPAPKSVASPLQRGSLEIAPEFCSDRVSQDDRVAERVL